MEPKIARMKPPIVSDLLDEPSPLDLIELYEENSERFVNLNSLFAFATYSLPTQISSDLFKTYTAKTMNYGDRYDDICKKIIDFLQGVKVLRTVDIEHSELSIAEIHRPKIDGCKASCKLTYSLSTDFSISVKVFGIGGGASKGRKYGFADTIETADECLRLAVPVKIKWEECRTNAGTKFLRSNVENIGKDYQPRVLKTPEDNCRLDLAKGECQLYEVPTKGSTQNISRSVEAGQAAEISLQTTIAGAEIGPKVVVKYNKQIECSYTLIGPHKYFAYLPKNSIAYYWNWS
jgi:hypothetical protein